MNLFINCSPKLNLSNSEYFINLTKNNNDIINYLYKDNFDKIIKNITYVDKIIFVFPLYLDTLPSKLIEFLEYFNSFDNKKIYVICNCGFLENIHNELAIKNIKYIINKNNGIFMGYLNIGAGEIIGITKKNKLLKILCRDFFKKMNTFKKNYNNNKYIEINTTIKVLNKKLFCLICNHFWKKRII